MSLSNNFPTIAPSLNLSFALTKALDPRISFVRTTTATYYGTETAKAEENLLIRSEEFDNASWVNSNSTDTANTEVAPDGTTTADTITDNATDAPHFMSQTVTLSTSTVYTASVFLKAGTNDYAGISMRANGSSDYHGVVCDLSAGTITQTNTQDFTSASSSITSVGNGWYRVTITATSPSAISGANVVIVLSDSATPASISNGIPSYIGTGTTIFAWGAQLEQRSAVTAYTPTTTQPITNYVPALQTAASGVARFDHNPTTGESLGLLVEEQRTNLLTYSEEFDNAAWTKTRSSITANTIVAPDGTLTGDKLVEDTTASNTHLCQQAVSFTSGTSYTMTVYAKAGERPAITLVTGGVATASSGVRFNLTTGVAVVATGTIVSFSMTSVGNGWYRCQMTQAATSTASDSWQIRLDTGSTTLYTGDGYSGLYIWGAQLEASSFSTSYIPTVAATVTRNADAASMTGTNFSSWFNNAEGSLYAEASVNNASTAVSIAAINDNTFQNMLRFFYRATNLSGVQLTNGNVTQADLTPTGSLSANQPFKLVAAYKVNDIASSVNAGTVATDTSATIPVVNQMAIGFTSTGAPVYTNGYIKKIAFYGRRLSNAELQALTTV